MNKNQGIAVIVALLVAAGFLGRMIYKNKPMTTDTGTDSNGANTNLSTNTQSQNMDQNAQAGSQSQNPQDGQGLVIKDIVAGTGKEVKKGNTVTVHYTGKLTNGKVFDSSSAHGQPFSFKIGEGFVIKGWEEGLIGMKEGGKRNLIISPEYGYGDKAVGAMIPANSTLIFDIELIKVE